MKRVLVHGLGSIGRRHLRVIRAADATIELAALSEHGSQLHPGESGVPVFRSMAQAQAFRPEAVVVANAAVGHVESAMAWLRAGAHVLIEKPLAAALDGTADLAALAQVCGHVVQVGYNLRHSPGLQQMRAWCGARRLGRVHSVRAEVGQHLATWRHGADPLRSVSARRALGGGVLLELSHEIDYLQWLLGPVAWVSAHLMCQGGWDIDVEDSALLTLGFAGTDGCVAALQMDFVRHDATRRCTLIGDAGSLQWDALAGRLQARLAGSADWDLLPTEPGGRDATYAAQWAGFVTACAGQGAPAVTLAEGVRVLRVVEAVRHSSMLGGQRVPVEAAP
ncbi:Gfo/Idh/MocA family oxidoreductase [Acidovorax lacteus]|uniref:Gfo/Idh/MocA family oxidoreductase n=1 Tax=Acidovorax lacteus TaxID=1924988 RepID=A0ABP8LH97_9BURK